MFVNKALLSLVLATATKILQCNAFTPISPITTNTPISTRTTYTDTSSSTTSVHHQIMTTTTSQLNLAPVSEFMDSEGARKLFFLWFFGSTGGGGIAVGQFPQMYQGYQKTQSLKGEGPTLGGEKIGLSPLCGYPEDLCVKDLQKIFNNKMSVETMVEKGPKDSFLAVKGYLRYNAFVAANKNCNPLALRAVFDAMTTSADTVSPIVAQEKLDAFKDDIGAFKSQLLFTKLQGYSAIGFLLFLLGIAAATCAGSLALGWFPDWPGNQNFPVSLISPGIWTIPEYWI
mmetsp:Transcript_6348/g.7107  ORF Transcript_6348/g.7107 Transcript_6348/m.7107 type:complete len:286 (-) Transcript_6348:86-943(-)